MFLALSACDPGPRTSPQDDSALGETAPDAPVAPDVDGKGDGPDLVEPLPETLVDLDSGDLGDMSYDTEGPELACGHDINPGDTNPGDTEPGDTEPGDAGTDTTDTTDAPGGDTDFVEATEPETTDAEPGPDGELTDIVDTAAPDPDSGPNDVDSGPGPDTDTGPACSPCAIGRIRYERRQPNAPVSALGPLEFAPLRHHPVGLVGTPHHTLTDADGNFALPLPPGSTCHLGFAALWPRDPAAPFVAPKLAVLGTELTELPHIGSPAFQAERLWAWSSTCTPDLTLDLTVRLSEGAGALSAFETAHEVLSTFVEHFGPTEVDLAIVWQPSRAWSCGSCYLDTRFSGVTHTASNHHFPRAIFLSGNNANPHHFTPSIIAHELGHFALDLWSAPPLIGGTHGFDRRVAPVLAWSEGAATLIGQWALIDKSPVPQRFFAVQQNVQYWIDLEAIGRSPISDDSNINLLVPLPRPLDPPDQPLSEGVVAAILWDLLDAAPEVAGEVIALGPLLVSLLADARLANVRAGGLDRGALGPDLVDLLDALRCDASLDTLVGGPAGTLPSPLTNLFLGFPYDDLPLCPSGSFRQGD